MTDLSCRRASIIAGFALAVFAGAAMPASAQTGLGTPGGGSAGINTTGAGTGLSSPGTIRGSTATGPGFSNPNGISSPNTISNPGLASPAIGSSGPTGAMTNPGIGVPAPAVPSFAARIGRAAPAAHPR